MVDSHRHHLWTQATTVDICIQAFHKLHKFPVRPAHRTHQTANTNRQTFRLHHSLDQILAQIRAHHSLDQILAQIRAHHSQAQTQAIQIRILVFPAQAIQTRMQMEISIPAMTPVAVIETLSPIHTIEIRRAAEIHTAIKRRTTIQDHLVIFSTVSLAAEAITEAVVRVMEAAVAALVDRTMAISLGRWEAAGVQVAESQVKMLSHCIVNSIFSSTISKTNLLFTDSHFLRYNNLSNTLFLLRRWLLRHFKFAGKSRLSWAEWFWCRQQWRWPFRHSKFVWKSWID